MNMTKKATPLMKQYNAIKAKYPDALLLFRVGDFYETFGKDAVESAGILDITLTKRANGSASEVELAGFPHHALDTYLPKLVKAGKRVAICDQLEDPKETKGIVKRGVTEIVTPGVTFDQNVLSQKQNNFLIALYKAKNEYGIALLDISTGEFLVAEGDENKVKNILESYQPKELLFPRGQKMESLSMDISTQRMEDWAFQYDYAQEKLTAHFQTQSLKGFGVEENKSAIIAAGAIYAYLVEGTHHSRLDHISEIQWIADDEYMFMDAFTIQNLELIHPNHSNGKSLIQILDNTKTAMGGRMLKRWLLLPLIRKEFIERRQNIVKYFLQNSNEIESLLPQILDVERLVGKLASHRISPKELGALRDSIASIQQLKEVVEKDKVLRSFFPDFQNMTPILEILYTQLKEELPVQLQKGNVIKEGFSQELDHYRNLRDNAQEFLQKLQNKEIDSTGISSLKVGFNNVFGYYYEVTHTHKDKVPENWIRKQTLKSAERYITEDLKEYEEKILNAESQISQVENELYVALMEALLPYFHAIQKNAKIVAEIDVLNGFATIAEDYQYVLPHIQENGKIELKGARHPVIERLLPLGETYIPNDLYLDPKKQQILMITGPNMSGKSALLRQTALVSIMAQMGSYVPAKSANLSILDKVFTRVGASDNLSQGESTFMVEMNETASILNNFTENSLILLDEIGRGTSTYDGVSIAWAIAEYLHQSPKSPKTLFATHYHELNEMTHTFPKIKNFNVSIKEIEGKIHFVRKLQAGGSEHSFGINVAELAGMPKKLTERAKEILRILEENRDDHSLSDRTKKITEENFQLSFFQLDDPVLSNIRDELLNIDINTLTPVEALLKLNQIKKLLGR